MVDASAEGNETRFINHSSTRANVKAQGLRSIAFDIVFIRLDLVPVKVVDADHQIGIYACKWPSEFYCLILSCHAVRAIRAGEEILLDYGQEYFIEEHPASSPIRPTISLGKGS